MSALLRRTRPLLAGTIIARAEFVKKILQDPPEFVKDCRNTCSNIHSHINTKIKRAYHKKTSIALPSNNLTIQYISS